MNKKLQVIIFTVSYMLGLIAFLTGKVILFGTIFFVLLLVLTFKKIFGEKYSLILFLIFLTGILNCSLRIKNFDFLTTIAPHNEVTVIGTVSSLPSTSSEDFTKFNLKAEQYYFYRQKPEKIRAKTLVTLSVPKDLYKNIEVGDRLSLTGRLVKPKTASNPSEFCYSTFLKFKGIHSRLFVEKGNYSIISKAETTPAKFLSNMNRLRNKIIEKHAKNVKSPELELLGGIVFGDDAVSPTEEMKTSFQNSGLTHIIAASGMNVSMIFGVWFFISQIFRLNYKFSVFTGIFAVICYTCMTGFGPPVLRASLMLILILIGKLADKKANSVNLLFIVAFLMCLFSPTMITNIGFQLSFAVTFGLLLVYPVFFEKIKNKILSTLISFVAVPFVAQVFAAPIQMFYFNSFSPYSVFANIAVVPTLGIVSFGGFISSIFSLIKPVSFVCIRFFDFILMPFLTFITAVAKFFSDLPYSSVTVASPSVFQIVVYYAVVLCLIFYFSDREKYKKCIFASLILFVCLVFTLVNFGEKRNEIIFFSVDNADSALITTSEGSNILIDTGKMPYNNFSPAAERIIWKYFKNNGINTLDLLVLSHFDSDHAGGTTFLTDKVTVKKMSVRNTEDTSPLAAEIFQNAKERNIPVSKPNKNEIIFDDGVNKLYAFYSENGDDNDKSTVNIFETPFGSTLFTGDCGGKALSELKEYIPDNIKVLKVPHHGAKDTLTEEFLSGKNIEAGIISTGFNIYGHPHKETLDLLSKHNITVLRTDVDNAVKVVFSKNKILLYSYNNRRKKFERINQ